jgi:hypothetical protein
MVVTIGFRYPTKLASGIPQDAAIQGGRNRLLSGQSTTLESIIQAMHHLLARLLITQKVLALQRVMAKMRSALATL